MRTKAIIKVKKHQSFMQALYWYLWENGYRQNIHGYKAIWKVLPETFESLTAFVYKLGYNIETPINTNLIILKSR